MLAPTLDRPATGNGRLNSDAHRAPLQTPAETRIIVADDGAIIITAAQLAANLRGRPAEHIATMEWLRGYAVARKWTYKVLASKLHQESGMPYNKATISHIIQGHRAADAGIGAVCEAVERMRRQVETPAPVNGFFETKMMREMKAYLEEAKAAERIGFIIGQNFCGKSVTLAHLERRDPAMTLVRVPEGGHLLALLRATAKRRGMAHRGTVQDLREPVLEDFQPGEKFVADEADQCFLAKTKNLGNNTLDFLRRAYDAGLALTMVMDIPGYKQLMTVGVTDRLRRLYTRRHEPLILPKFYREDLDLFAAAVGLDPSPETLVKVGFKGSTIGGKAECELTPRSVEESVCASHRDGLGAWLAILTKAKALAGDAGKDTTWGWVLKAYSMRLAGDDAARTLCLESEAGK